MTTCKDTISRTTTTTTTTARTRKNATFRKPSMPKRTTTILPTTPSSHSTRRSSASRSPYALFFLDFEKRLFDNYFSCATPPPPNTTFKKSSARDESNKTQSSNSSYSNSNSTISDDDQDDNNDVGFEHENDMIALFDEAPIPSRSGHHPATATTTTTTTALSQEELSAVIVMKFDEYGKLRDDRSANGSIDSNNSIAANSIETPYGLAKKNPDTHTVRFHNCAALDRLTNQEYGTSDDAASSSTGGSSSSSNNSCRLMERVKRRHQIIQMANTKHYRETDSSASLREQQSRIISMEELAGFNGRKSYRNGSGSSDRRSGRGDKKMKKKNPSLWTTTLRKAKIWASELSSSKTNLDKTTSPGNKSSVSVSSTVGSSSLCLPPNSPVSILRKGESILRMTSNDDDHEVSLYHNTHKNHHHIHAEESPITSTVRFAEGTVFQDPYKVKRRKCPRLPVKLRASYLQRQRQRQQQASSSSSSSLESSMRALSAYDNGLGCNPIDDLAPFVQTVLASSMDSCYVFR